jgi:hypothetical protein
VTKKIKMLKEMKERCTWTKLEMTRTRTRC